LRFLQGMRGFLFTFTYSLAEQAGLLTAGDVDDNLNFDHCLGFMNRTAPGVETREPNFTAPDLSDRVVVKVRDSRGAHFPCAAVTASLGQRTQTFPVGTNGVLYLFPTLDGFGAGSLSLTAVPPGGCSGECVVATGNTGSDGGEVNLVIEGAIGQLPTALDVVFVVDATTSMDDEISYLSTELTSVMGRVQEAISGVDIRVGLSVYRDPGETLSYGLSHSIPERADDLRKQRTGGGLEAMIESLDAALQMDWRAGNTARVIFVVTDEPPQSRTYARTVQAAQTARSMGIRMMGLAASGADTTAEYLLRLFAAITGGRHLFLTDDSGIGNPHGEPAIQCYQVTRLDSLLLRVLKSELLGERVEPAEEEVTREVGRQQGGVCIVDLTSTTTTTTTTTVPPLETSLRTTSAAETTAGTTDAMATTVAVTSSTQVLVPCDPCAPSAFTGSSSSGSSASGGYPADASSANLGSGPASVLLLLSLLSVLVSR